ncbi:DUF1643 domain-containing protein [Hydrogenophaga atypica]|uniref:DUF1643 domain-containing protein n=1 Tax=Hydrogenophaga atypica TaxID=249409 RepID=A0ABW2QIS2_9BURK
MPPPIVVSFRAFAEAHQLPEPVVRDDKDGEHVFVYSHDQSRRYAYALTWATDQPRLLWVMLNPGTGETEGRRRNTFERCKRWSHELGYGGLMFGNVFSLRTRSARDLLKRPEPADDLNSEAMELLSTLASCTIVAWGNHGARSDRSAALLGKLIQPCCFGITLAGQPRHPLYVPRDTPLRAWLGAPTVVPLE